MSAARSFRWLAGFISAAVSSEPRTGWRLTVACANPRFAIGRVVIEKYGTSAPTEALAATAWCKQEHPVVYRKLWEAWGNNELHLLLPVPRTVTRSTIGVSFAGWRDFTPQQLAAHYREVSRLRRLHDDPQKRRDWQRRANSRRLHTKRSRAQAEQQLILLLSAKQVAALDPALTR
jgi:hypothetical protein